MRHVVDEQQPLSEAVFLTLTSLAEGPNHGYALIKDIEELSGGRVRLSTGTLFGALRRMLEAEWIERYEAEDTSRDKQSYRIKPAGRERLIGDLNRMRALTRSAASRLKIGGK
jgi:DNA-binding PadR family transcriptional regulator